MSATDKHRLKFASAFFKEKWGERAQKIPLNAGFTCPNRNSHSDGCIYCNNTAFSPFYCDFSASLEKQLFSGYNYFKKRYKTNTFLAYFQSYTGTFCSPEHLTKLYNQILKHDFIKGIVIGTRPDCLPNAIISVLKDFASETYLKVEIGAESFDDEVLNFANRGHNSDDIKKAVEALREANIDVGLHLLLGLPFEKESFIEETGRELAKLDYQFLKLHHLQILKGTKLAEIWKQNPEIVKLYSPETYKSDLKKLLPMIAPNVYIERLISRVPESFLLAPRWDGLTENDLRADLNDYFQD
ncbi:MAG: TIGR01212 family radical SAM protein [Candidatus Riflebacteria bacterium]|nr:TIGR01212 family radical SAM protein [Candidatus Riflebacteria bacterium]